MKRVSLFLFLAGPIFCQQTDPAWSFLDQAYQRQKGGDFDAAIVLFMKASTAAPRRTDIRKNLAYTLLKTGATEAARDQFFEAMQIDPSDHQVALEYAFLAFETKRAREARVIFDRVRKVPGGAWQATAEAAFQSIDRPLADGIARWSEIALREPANFSAHQEIARLADERSDFERAARHALAAWRLKPSIRSLLIDLGRAYRELGRQEDATTVFLAASRGSEPRSAEVARELLGARYPFVYEFRRAIEFEQANVELRRELAYLLLEMDQKPEAEQEFTRIVEAEPKDLLSAAQLGFLRLKRSDAAGAIPLLQRVVDTEGVDDELADRVRSALGLPKTLVRRPDGSRKQVSEEARDLAQRSLDAGYLKDALKYLTVAHENDPVDFQVILKLGWTNNNLKQDRAAVDWFNLARRAPDPAIAAEAQRAYTNLKPQFQRFRTTGWATPFYSSRWKDVFAYGQAKVEYLPSAGALLRPYLSVRFIGDARGRVDQAISQYLSETAVIVGAGVSTPYYKGLMAWGEAGSAFSYLNRSRRSDYRGGVSFSRMNAGQLFFENHADAVFVSRFDNTMVFYSQNRLGHKLRGGAQAYWNINATADAKRQYWANFVETGPGIRLNVERYTFNLDVIRGAHTINVRNPRRPNFTDVRLGVWYAFTR